MQIFIRHFSRCSPNSLWLIVRDFLHSVKVVQWFRLFCECVCLCVWIFLSSFPYFHRGTLNLLIARSQTFLFFPFNFIFYQLQPFCWLWKLMLLLLVLVLVSMVSAAVCFHIHFIPKMKVRNIFKPVFFFFLDNCQINWLVEAKSLHYLQLQQ